MIPCCITSYEFPHFFKLRFKGSERKFYSRAVYCTPMLVGNNAIVLTYWNAQRNRTEWCGLLVSMEFYAKEVEPHA